MNYYDFTQVSNRHFLLNTARTVKLIYHHQIAYIVAESNYSKIILDDKTEYLLSKTLGLVETEINDSMFFRCHRTYLVNTRLISEIFKGDEMCIILKNGHRIPLAKRRMGDLRRILMETCAESVYSKY
jgi:two-component system LytT family response regulator